MFNNKSAAKLSFCYRSDKHKLEKVKSKKTYEAIGRLVY